MAERIALGADPGLANTGFGVVARAPQKLEFLDAGTIATDSARPLEEREQLIWETFSGLVREYRPVVIGIEDQSGVNAAARQNVARQLAAARAGRAVKGFGFNASNDGVIEVVGILKAVAFAYRVRVVMLQPRTIKVQLIGAGAGQAEKVDVKAGVVRVLPALVGARLSSHAADGLATAITAERVDFIESRRFG
jgi:crossover junction endodeoxyribonuclease RuvC